MTRLTVAVAALFCASCAALIWVDGSARGQADQPDVAVVNGVVQVNTEAGFSSVSFLQDLQGDVMVQIIARPDVQVNIGAGCQLVTSNPGSEFTTYVIECPGAKGHLFIGSSERDVVKVDSNLSLTAQLGGGDDKLTSQAPTGFVNGGPGDDRIKVGVGSLQGDPRARGAVLIGGGGRDRLVAGKGHDTCSGGNGQDTIRGGAGNDTLNGDGGGDRLIGGRGRDNLNGGPGKDTGKGGPGTDRVRL